MGRCKGKGLYGWDSGSGVPCVFFLDILNRASALYTPHREPRCVAKATHHPRLPLQRTLHRLVEFRRLVQAHDIDVPIRRCDDHQLVLDVHTVHPLLALQRRDWIRLPQVPILDRLVPGARHKHGCVRARRFDEADASNRLVVRGDLLRRRPAGSEIEHAGCFVRAAAGYFGAILRSIQAQSAFSPKISRKGPFVKILTFDQQQLSTGASCSNSAFPSLPPCALIS